MGRRIFGALLASAVAVLLAWQFLGHGWPPRAILRGVPPDPLALLAPLDRSVTADFDEAPLSEVLAHLESATGVALPLDIQALVDAGEQPDTPVTLHIDEAPLEWALDELFRQLKLDLGVRDGALLVTAPGEGLVSIVHPVGAVSALHGIAAHEIERLLREIDPRSWEGFGGVGASQVTPGGILVVQNLRNQRSITQLLATLARPFEGTHPVRIDGQPWQDERLARRVTWRPELTLDEQLKSLCRQAGLRVLLVKGVVSPEKCDSNCDQTFEASLATALRFWMDEVAGDDSPSLSIRGELLRIGTADMVCVHPLTGLSRNPGSVWGDLVAAQEPTDTGLSTSWGWVKASPCVELKGLLVAARAETVQWRIESLLARVRRASGLPTHRPLLLAEEDRTEAALRGPVPEIQDADLLGAFAERMSDRLGVGCVTREYTAPAPSLGNGLAPTAEMSCFEWLGAQGIFLEMSSGGILRLSWEATGRPRRLTRFYQLPSRPIRWPHCDSSESRQSLSAPRPYNDVRLAIESLTGERHDEITAYPGTDAQVLFAKLSPVQHLRVEQFLETLERVERGEFDGVTPADPRQLPHWSQARDALRRPLPEPVEAGSLGALLDQLSAATGVRFAMDADADLANGTLRLPADDLPLGLALTRVLLPVGRTFDVHANGVRVRQMFSEQHADELRLYPVGDLLNDWAGELGGGRDRHAQARHELARFLTVANTHPSWPYLLDGQSLVMVGDTLVVRCGPSFHERIEEQLDRLRRPGAAAWGERAWRDRGWTREFDEALERPLSLVANQNDHPAEFLRQVAESIGLERYVAIDESTSLTGASQGSLSKQGSADFDRILFVRCPARDVLERSARLHQRTTYIHRGVLTLHTVDAMPLDEATLHDHRAGRAVFEAQREALASGPNAWRQARGLDRSPPTLSLEWQRFGNAQQGSLPLAASFGPWLVVTRSAETMSPLAMIDDLTFHWSGTAAPERSPDEWRTRITWEGADVLLADVVRQWAEQAGISLRSTPECAALWQVRVTKRIHGRPLDEALPELLAEHGLGCDWERALLVVHPSSRPGTAWTRLSLRPLWERAGARPLEQAVRLLGQVLQTRETTADEVSGMCRVLDQVLVSGRSSLLNRVKRLLSEESLLQP